jgi:hypothetical protein
MNLGAASQRQRQQQSRQPQQQVLMIYWTAFIPQKHNSSQKQQLSCLRACCLSWLPLLPPLKVPMKLLLLLLLVQRKSPLARSTATMMLPQAQGKLLMAMAMSTMALAILLMTSVLAMAPPLPQLKAVQGALHLAGCRPLASRLGTSQIFRYGSSAPVGLLCLGRRHKWWQMR